MAEQQPLKLKKTGGNAELYGVFRERIAAFRKDPPGPAWDGVYTLETQ
ncbi:MAG: hypothetical protein OEP48_10775 [Betaproteobacteria bacterium]|nr:hypothetical protein [Betaproteobacteria bacterium]